MPNLSTGTSANIILSPGDVYRVSSTGTATVLGAYGAPSTTTTIIAGTVDFGPYDAPAKLRVTAVSGQAQFNLRGYTPPALSLAVPAAGTALAARASQAGYDYLIDQGPNRNVLSTNTAVFPVAWLADAVVPANAYRTPPILNGFIYKAGSSGGTNGSTAVTWPTTVGATVVSGTVTYTCEKGPYFIDNSGVKLFRSLASSQVGAPGTHSLPAKDVQWDMALGQSLIVNLRLKFDYAASGQAAASPILSNRELTGTNRGCRIVGTGGSFNDLRFNVRDSLGNSILSDNLSTTFARKPLDGTERNTTMLICGALKMMFVSIDGIPLTQADMFSGTSICPNGMSLASITGSTQGGMFTFGGDPLGTTSFECAGRSVDVTVLPGGLPANIQNIASWYARGGEGVLPQALVA